MKSAIVYYSRHHGNTKKLIDAIAEYAEVTLVDVAQGTSVDLRKFDCIGFASGIYFASFAKPILNFAEKYLPENKKVFFMNTCGVKSPIVYFDAIRKITKEKNCRELGTYQCRGYDTFGPFKLVGGIAKGHPNANEITAAVHFYQKIERKRYN